MNLVTMIMKRMNNIILITCLIAFSIITKMSECGGTSANENRNLFAANIFQKVATGKTENVIFSPASIQTCLAMSFFATDGQTSEELRSVLKLGNGKREEIAKTFEEFVSSSFKNSNDSNAVQLRMANRIFVNDKLNLKSNFNQITSKAFQSEAEKVNFADSKGAITKINSFVEEKTQQKIKNLLQSGAVDGDTSVVLINAIYFKGKWTIPFSADSTRKENFAVKGKNNVPVDTMHMTEYVQYGEFPDLNAKVLELSYQNSDLSMMILLPNSDTGLQNLEEKLANKDLNEISSKLERYEVSISLPKFHIEYDIDLVAPLQALGLKTLFTNNADFSGLLESDVKQKVSDVKHKAVIDVNEAGSEAAAATFMKITPMSLNFDQKVFKANHPFVFAIRNTKAVYFAGHVLKL